MKIIYEKHAGREIFLKVQEKLEVNLRENPSTGFTWMEEIIGKQILKLEKEDFLHDEITQGGNSLHKWLFNAEKTGIQKLKFIYQRPWLTNSQPGKEFEVTVHVHHELF
ncbi:protease inhibitor I42 family protein [Bacillus paralicheniformis]|uniref:protease inhibitor I42 family protein n=1 Tax=Bacillus paralicheniformis TaxID=1648923 RepID=UPI003981FEAE